MKPDRIVVGVESKQAEEIMSRLYKPFTLNGHPVIFMDVPSAEMTKYAANAMLATKISFMNDIANVVDRNCHFGVFSSFPSKFGFFSELQPFFQPEQLNQSKIFGNANN